MSDPVAQYLSTYGPKKNADPVNDYLSKYGKPKEKPDAFSLDALLPVAQGATFGFGDEILAGIHAIDPTSGPGTVKEKYAQKVKEIRDKIAAYREANPKSNFALEMAGGLIPAVGSGGATAVAKQGLKQAVKAGAGYGALAGAGNAEGDLTERAKGALLGGATGAVVGGAIHEIPNTVRFARNITGLRAKSSAGSLADDLVAKSLERDSMTPQDLLNAATEAKASGKPNILPDLAGENTLGLARAAQATPSKAKEALAKTLTERQEGQLSRLSSDLESQVRTGQKDAHAVGEELLAQREREAAPFYEAAHPKTVKGEVFSKALELPRFQQAFNVGRRIAATEGETLPDFVGLSKQFGTGVTDKIPLTIKSLDYMKQGLDDVIDSRMRAGKMGRKEARALRNRLDQVLAEADKQVPEYGKARQLYAGPSRLNDALEEGRDFLKQDSRVTASDLARKTDSEREMYRIGGMDAIRQEMEKAQDGADLTRRLFGSPDKRQKLKVLFPDEKSFNEFAKSVEQEAKMVKTSRTILGGSPTARIAAELSDLGGENIGEAALRGGAFPHSIPFRVAAAAMKKRAQGISQNVADELSQRMLMSPDQVIQYSPRLEKKAVQVARSRLRNRIAQRVLANKAGSAVGGLGSGP